MKKILIYIGLVAIVATACDPNQDFLDELEKDVKSAGIDIPKDGEYTLTEDDYDIVEKGEYDNFNSDEEAAELIPDILTERYAANSSDGKFELKVFYDVYRGSLSYLKDIIQFKKDAEELDSYTLTTEDYDSMGTEYGEPGRYDNFSGSTPPEDYLPDFLLAKYPDAASEDEMLIIYKYYIGGGVTVTKSDIYSFDGSIWANTKVTPEVPEGVELYELTYSDYNAMGEPGNDDSFSSVNKAEDFLPIFLTQKYPYAMGGEKVALIYKDDDEFDGEEYTFDGTNWNPYESTIESSAQFKFDGSVWAVVPPIKFVKTTTTDGAIVYGELTDEDYALVGNGFYKNFDVRAGKTEETEEQRIAKLTKILKERYPNLQVGEVYFIEFKIYKGDEDIASQDSNGNGLWDIYLEAVEDSN